MRRQLLSLIHRFYLDAVSRLPAADLRTTLARGLLVAGHCYGPLHPVHNILLNSIWYAAAFPLRAADRIDIHVVSSDGIVRACRRSLDGLVASLRHYCPSLSAGDALWHLMSADADLSVAVALANRTSKPVARAAMRSQARGAFQAAAEAAWHPNPAALGLFASSVLPAVERDIAPFLRVKHILSAMDIEYLSAALVPALPNNLPQPPLVLSPRVHDLITSHKKLFKDTEKAVLEVVTVALRKHTIQSGEQFVLHSVCGVNLLNRERSESCYHINFLAYRKASGSVLGAPVLFFTEAIVPASLCDDINIGLCVLVDPSTEIGSCFACETNKKKIVHPTYDEYLGGQDFQVDDTDNDIGFLNPLDVDHIFFDAERDSAFANYLDGIISCDKGGPPGGLGIAGLTESFDAARQRSPDARALRRRLLGLLRCYYLVAISRVPTADLRTTFAHGLLVAGHCYGPLHPVHNIILNSVWYAAAFPLDARCRIDVDVITDTAIGRVVHRSLDGLVASLRHHCPGLSHDDALWHLILSRADLRAAVASACGAAPSLFRPAEGPEAEAAFLVAAEAARHPKPAALSLFASSVVPFLERDAVSLLTSKRRLSSPDILRLSRMLLPFPVPDELPQPPLREQSTPAFPIIARRRKNLRRWYKGWLEIADAALCKYAQQTGAHYQLHTIYGVGTLQDEFQLDESFHINFMAFPKDPSSASEAPVFFFAEAFCNSDLCEEDITLCCPVQPSPSEVDSCHVCLRENFRIDHPEDSEHFGGLHDKMDEISNDWVCPITIDVDYRFFDPDRDIDFVDYLHQDFARYKSSSTRYKHKSDTDLDILDYCRVII